MQWENYYDFAELCEYFGNFLYYIDVTLGCLREAGFLFETADHAWNASD
jgi:hypothetical protein